MISNCDHTKYGGQKRATQNLQYLHMLACTYAEEKKYILRNIPDGSTAYEYFNDADLFPDLSALATSKMAEISAGPGGKCGLLLIESTSMGYGLFSDRQRSLPVDNFREKLRLRWLGGDPWRYQSGRLQIKALVDQCNESQSSGGGEMEVEDEPLSLLLNSEHPTTLAPSQDEMQDESTSADTSDTEKWTNRLLGNENQQLPYLEDAKCKIFEFRHMEPQGLYKMNSMQWGDYRSLDEHDIRDIVGRQCYEVERPSIAFAGGAQLGIEFDKFGSYNWERLEVELPYRRDALHSLVMKSLPTILDDCYEMGFDWERAMKEKVHSRDLYLRLADRPALHMRGYLDDGSQRSEMMLEQRRYVMAYVRACVLAKEQLPLSFLKKDSDDEWAKAPGIISAAFQLFKCVGLTNKKEGRDISYKARQGDAVQRAITAVMDPWLKGFMGRVAPACLKYCIEAEKRASKLEEDLPDDEQEERFSLIDCGCT